MNTPNQTAQNSDQKPGQQQGGTPAPGQQNQAVPSKPGEKTEPGKQQGDQK
jgi:hypothetical protein